ncbi:MAG: glycosyltransferase family 4 protein [Deltaproteobacteria bacterium]|nr:glycosyltransferase family 4 protein [Deltaproteobacteria bacterium]
MHVVLANLHWSPRAGADWFDPRHGDTMHAPLALALARLGLRVTVVQEGPVASRSRHEEVDLVVVPPSRSTRLARWSTRWRPFPAAHSVARSLVEAVAEARPDRVHSFDLVAYPTLRALGAIAPVVATFHGGAAVRSALRWPVEAGALRRVRACFTTREQAEPWIANGTLAAGQVEEVFELSSQLPFRRGPRLPGSPAMLHLGRFHPVKDFDTTLRGTRKVMERHPGVVLHLAWREGTPPPTGDVPTVRHSDAPPERVAELLAGADCLVQASVREVCGRAPMEAMASGCVPVLSAIPPWRRLLGTLPTTFAVGDAEGLAAAVDRALLVPPEAVRARFDAALSWERIAARYAEIYARPW